MILLWEVEEVQSILYTFRHPWLHVFNMNDPIKWADRHS
jgi:hypothetical protein